MNIPSLSCHPLSYGQRALWHIQRLMPECPVYNVFFAWQILSELDIAALQRSLQWLVDRHASLRTTYALDDREAVQCVHPAQKIYFKIHQASEWGPDELNQELEREAYRPFNLEKGPLLRVNLYLREPGTHVLLVSFHHIAVDLWSSTTIFDELRLLYPAAKGEKQSPLPPLKIHFADYVRWQKDMLSGPRGEKLWQYWRPIFSGDIQPLNLPIQLTRRPHQTFVGTAHPFKIGRETTSLLRNVAADLQTTLFTVLVAGFQTLLFKYSGQDRFLIRSLAAGRSRAEFENIVGFFANPVVLEADFTRRPTFLEVLHRAKKNVAKMIENQDFPFELLMEKLRFGRDIRFNPNPEVMFILQTPQKFVSVRRETAEVSRHGVFAPGKTGIRLNLGGLVLEKYNLKQRVTLNDLAIEMAEVGNELSGAVHYHTELFDPPSIVSLAKDYQELLAHMVRNLHRPVSAYVLREGLLQPAGEKAAKVGVQGHRVSPPLKRAYAAPRLPIEEKLVAVWQEVLGLKHIGIFDNFFEKGGTSLQALQLMTTIRDAFQVELSLRELFKRPTIAGLAESIGKSQLAPQPPAIQPAGRKGRMPLSFSQERLWFLEQLMKGKAFNSIALAFRLKGRLDIEVLNKCLNVIIERHEILRTTFPAEDGLPVQVIAPKWRLSIPLLDLTSLPEAEKEKETQKLASEEAGKPFNLEKGPLMRIVLLKWREEDHVALLTMHHIISDGWSLGVLFREFSALYDSYVNNKPCRLAELPIHYADYAIWQRQWLRGDTPNDQVAYWKETLKDMPGLNLPTDRPRPPVQTFRGASRPFKISKSLAKSLQLLSRKEGVTPFMTLLAAFQTLLHRYTQQEDIAIGTPVAGRSRKEVENLIGCFINILVLRADLSGDPSFRELLKRVRQTALDAYAHQDLPFEKLVDTLHPDRDLSREPLFQVMFALQDIRLPPRQIPGGPALSVMEIERGISRYDLTLFLAEEGREMRGLVEYNSALFDRSTIERLIGHFLTLLKGIIAHPEKKLSELPILTQEEKHRILVEWNDTRRDYPRRVCAHELFESKVRQAPEAVAVVYGNEHLNYRELDQRANQLAHHLKSLGAEKDRLVGICLEHSPQMIVGILGILKSGAAYVPLDPSLPDKRLHFMIEDTGMTLLVTRKKFSARLAGVSSPQPTQDTLRMILLDDHWPAISRQRKHKPLNGTRPENTAYVIYTSGSTGLPKGTMVSHGAVVNYLSWCSETYNLKRGRGTLLHSSIAFDFSVTSLFTPLITGQSLVLAPQDSSGQARIGVEDLASDWSFLKLTPAQAKWLGEQLASKAVSPRVRMIILGGEELKDEHIAAWQKYAPQTAIINEYGPTEATVGCSFYKVWSGQKDLRSVPIGKPIANASLYVLDRYLNPVPVGIPGELYIGGAGLAKGYLNRPDLAAERFVANRPGWKGGPRLFRSGDLARYLPGGNIEFLGRVDDQVKIRGYRIEPGEIAFTLSRHPSVKQAAVIAPEDSSGEKYLAAYVVATPTHRLNVQGLRQFLRSQLPEYMVPKIFVPMEQLPVTPSGKLDRGSLPAPAAFRPDGVGEYLPPRSPLQKKLAKIWADVLGIEKIGLGDNFFDLGGHSLRALVLSSQIKKRLSLDLPLISLFEAPTIEEQEAVLREPQAGKRLSYAPGKIRAELVSLKPQGTGTPLFFIHPAGGGVSIYQALANTLDVNRPIYGVQSRGVVRAQFEHDSIPSMARDYARLIRSRQPRGPYSLLGWSMGGMIAVSIAEVLERGGQKVEFVGLLDTPLPGQGIRSRGQEFFESLLPNLARMSGKDSTDFRLPPQKLLRKIQEYYETPSLDPPNERAEKISRWILQQKLLRAEVPPDFLRQKLLLLDKHHRLLASLEPPRINSSLHIWTAQESREINPRRQKICFQKVTRGRVLARTIKGNHFSMLFPPSVEALAESIEKSLKIGQRKSLGS